MQRVDHVADVVDADVLAQIATRPVSVSTSIAARCVPCGNEKFSGSNVDSESSDGSMPSGKLCDSERREHDLLDRQALVGALDAEPAGRELEVVLGRLQQVRRDLLGLFDDLLRALDHGRAADGQRARAVGVHALRRDLGVAVQHLDVLERHAELVGHDLAPRRLVPLPVRGRAGDDLDLARGQHPDRRVLPAARAVAPSAPSSRDGARPHISVNVEMPMPSWTGSPLARRSSCSRRRPA